MTQKGRTPLSVIPSSSRDLYANIVFIFIEILRLRRPAGGSAQDDRKEACHTSLHCQDDKLTVFFNNQIARFKATPLEKRTLVVAVGCSLALLLRGNARMRTLLLLFPKISLRCDFWEPCLAPPICRTPAAFMKKGERTRFLLSLAKAKITLFAFAPCTARAVRRKRVNLRHL